MVPASSLPFLALSTTYSVAARVLVHHPPTAGATIPVVQVRSATKLSPINCCLAAGTAYLQ
jgi:hypothetical protein